MEFGGSTRFRLLTGSSLVAPLAVVLFFVPNGVFLALVLGVMVFVLSRPHSVRTVHVVQVTSGVLACAILVLWLVLLSVQEASTTTVVSQSLAARGSWLLLAIAESAILGIVLFVGAHSDERLFIYGRGCLVTLLAAVALLLILGAQVANSA